eukprot:jgi/Hompol1/425/HPOL_000142-RA
MKQLPQQHLILRRWLSYRKASEIGLKYENGLFVADAGNNKLALSLTPSDSKLPIVGWLIKDKAEAMLKTGAVDPNAFIENPEFETPLAVNQKEGFLNVNDQRVFSTWGRVNDPEDILGHVLLKDGVVQPNTYTRMPSHRLFSRNGLFVLTDFLHQKLIDASK